MPGFIYVAQGVNGTLKVGRSKNADRRALGLRVEFKRRGDRMERFEAVPVAGYEQSAEDGLIQAIAQREERLDGREWFRRGHFANAVRAAREMAAHYDEFMRLHPPPSPEQLEKWRADGLRHRAAREAMKKARAERAAAQAEVASQRRRLRLHGLHAFSRIAAELIGAQGAPAVPAAETAKAA